VGEIAVVSSVVFITPVVFVEMGLRTSKWLAEDVQDSWEARVGGWGTRRSHAVIFTVQEVVPVLFSND